MYKIGDMMSHVLSGHLILISGINKLVSLGSNTDNTAYHYTFIYLDNMREDQCYQAYLDRNYILKA